MREQDEQDPKTPSLELPELTREHWGWLALGTGAVSFVGALLHRDRSTLEWLLPLGLLGGGLALLLKEREKGIDRAEERIAAELAELDPLARAQILKRITSAELKGLKQD